MLLFRYKSYKHHDFIVSHNTLCLQNGSVWMMKAGKQTSASRVIKVMENGGWMILRSPKCEGSKSYLAHFSEFTDKAPSDGNYPAYYQEILVDENDEVFSWSNGHQWFRLTMICPLPDSCVSDIILSDSKMAIEAVIKTTRTAVMFVENQKQLVIEER